MSLLDHAELAVRKCEELGADEAEAFAQSGKIIEIILERGELHSERIKTEQGIGIRLIKDKKLGFSFSTNLEEPSLSNVCQTALKLARVSLPNPNWVSLPLPKKPSQIPEGVFDEETANLGGEAALSLAMRGYEAALNKDPRVAIDDGKLSIITEETAITNSHGISLTERRTLIHFFLVCIAREHGEASSFAYEYEISRSLRNFSPEKVGELAAEKAVASLKPKKVDSFLGQVILDSDPAAQVLFRPVISSINAENVQRGSSLWKNKLGEVVSNSKLTVVDDGRLPHGIASSSFDDEGVPRQRTIVIDGGVLKNFLHNSFTAYKEKGESTGNARREDYTGLPKVSVSNLVVEAGNKELEGLISEVERGVIVRRFSGTINEESGEFSGVAKQANYVENGEVKFPLRETMIVGNAFEALKNIVDIGREVKPTTRYVYAPPILLRSVRILSS